VSLDYIRNHYRVSAEKGTRVWFKYADRKGTIVGTSGAYISVLFDGDDEPRQLHPTWQLEYLETEEGGAK